MSFHSCAEERISSVLFEGFDGTRVLHSTSKETNPESILLSKSKEVRYQLDVPMNVPEGYSLEISYSFSVSENAASDEGFSLEDFETLLADWEHHSDVEVSFNEEQDSWILPVSLRTIGFQSDKTLPKIISYSVPLQSGTIDSFSIKVINNDSRFSREKISLNFHSFKIVPKWYGIAEEKDQLKITPFVYFEGAASEKVLAINPPEKFWIDHSELNVSSGEYFTIKSFQADPIEVYAQDISSIVLQSSIKRAFPLQPITLSASDSVSFDRTLWRRENFEVFRWNQFPSILIFDTADYDVQDKLLKRLAFFVEKAGFEGRLSTDEEIAHLHGWNAHDYRAEDLARFFETARVTNFPLNDEELALQQILLEQSIIVQDAGINDDGSIVPGTGAIVSISRESLEYLRYLFIVHESYHGLYFIDAAFEDFCRNRWENLDPMAKSFISEYFASQRYDTANEYLMANELMAYCLQQPVARAGDYFGKTLAGRIDANPLRRHVLPEKDNDSDSWTLLADLFIEESRAFSEYVYNRWGLRAGTLRIAQ
jgi:hypothetical protein